MPGSPRAAPRDATRGWPTGSRCAPSTPVGWSGSRAVAGTGRVRSRPPADATSTAGRRPHPRSPLPALGADGRVAGSRPRRARPSRVWKTDQLVKDLVAAGGVPVLPAIERDGTGVRQRAYAAQAAGKLPDGMALTTRRVGSRIELRLIPARSSGERITVAKPSPSWSPKRSTSSIRWRSGLSGPPSGMRSRARGWSVRRGSCTRSASKRADGVGRSQPRPAPTPTGGGWTGSPPGIGIS